MRRRSRSRRSRRCSVPWGWVSMARSKRRFFFAATTALLVPIALACNAITGLDDYEKAQCDNRTCDASAEGSDFDIFRPDAPGDQNTTDRQIDGPPGTKPVVWPQFRMPHYPDAALDATEPNHMSYASVGGGLLDNVTGRTWMNPMPADPTANNLTWDKAKDYCEKQAANGPWRLPSRIELVTLLDPYRSGPKIDPQFTGTQQGPYWTSSQVRLGNKVVTTRHWAVNFGDGKVVSNLDENGGAASVRCVKGGK